MNQRTIVVLASMPFLSVWLAVASQGQVETVSVDDPRPLAKALDVFEGRYGWIVTYEDPRYEQPADLEDVTERVRNPSARRSERRIIIPRGGTLSFNYLRPTADSDPMQVANVLTALIADHDASGYPGRFKVNVAAGRFDVTPVAFQRRDGGSLSQTSILDARISVPFQKDQSSYQALSSFVVALGEATGHKIAVGTVPLNLLAQFRIDLSANKEPARNVLVGILRATGRGLSWRLFFDPGLRLYVLNVHTVN